MVLTDREIQAAIHNNQILIDPVPDFAVALSSTSLDLTLHRIIRLWELPLAGVEQLICPADDGYSYNDIAEKHSTPYELDSKGFVLEPGRFILAWTVEEIALPMESKIAARVEGKSALARLGVGVHVTAPTIHAGFEGPIQLEIFNTGPLKVKLAPNMRVCQLIFEQTTGTPDKGYSGQFLRQIVSPKPT